MAMNLSCNLISLKEICLRRITVIVLNNFTSINFTSRELGSIIARRPCNVDLWRVDYIVRKLELPPVLTEQIKNLIQAICIQIENWKLFLKSRFISYDDKNYDGHCWILSLSQICWTNLGTIDRRNTAEKMIHLEQIDIVERYILACLYCLEDYIPILWELLPENNKMFFYEHNGIALKFCWPKILKGEENVLNQDPFGNTVNFNQEEFKNSAFFGNKMAAEFFFQKLNDDEREDSVLRAIQKILDKDLYGSFDCLRYGYDYQYDYLSEILFYLLFLLSYEKRMAILNSDPCKILKFLISWPWQDLFLHIADGIWDLLSAADYYYLLRKISLRMKSCHILKNLFQAFFLRGSSDFRKHFVVKECESMFCFNWLFRIDDSDTIKVLFRNVDSADRKRLGNCECVEDLFLYAFQTCEDRLVELFIKEAELSEKDKAKLQKTFDPRYRKVHPTVGRQNERGSLRHNVIASIKLNRILKKQEKKADRIHTFSP